MSSIVDADELERARSLVAAADQAASVHTLAAGVAHEVNNPLAYVMGNLSFALGELERVHAPTRRGHRAARRRRSLDLTVPNADPRSSEALAHAKEGSARIRDLVIDLLSLSSTPNGEDRSRSIFIQSWSRP